MPTLPLPSFLPTGLRESVQRHRDRGFLDAAMAAGALVAMADANVSFSEQSALDSVLRNIERLQVFDTAEAVSRHRYFVEQMTADSRVGEDMALDAIRPFRDDDEAALLILHIARYTALADQRVGVRERRALRRLCAALAVDAEAFGLTLSDTGER